MMIKLIMSDLDNTLLPLYTQEKFVDIWFRDVAKKFYEPLCEGIARLIARRLNTR